MNYGKPTARGNTASIYRSDGTAIKVFHKAQPDNEARYEAEKQKAACDCGLPVPRILDITRIDGKPAILMEYVEGPTFGELMLREPEKAEQYLALSAELQLCIHSKTAASLESMRERLACQLHDARQLDADCRTSLLKRLSVMPFENRLCHGDFHVHNLILSQNGPVIIDWVTACTGSPLADACRSYLLYTNVSSELADASLRLYCEKSGCDPADILVWLPIIAGARLAENVSTENEERLLKFARQGL